MKQKQQLFTRTGFLILKDKLSKYCTKFILIRRYAKYTPEKDITSSHDSKPIYFPSHVETDLIDFRKIIFNCSKENTV